MKGYSNSIVRALKKMKQSGDFLEYVLIERDKKIASTRIAMEENIVPDNVIRKLMKEDPIFKRIVNGINALNTLRKLSEEEKRKAVDEYFTNLAWVITSSAVLNEAITLLALSCLKVADSPRLIKTFNTDRSFEMSAVKKLQFLRFGNIIKEDTYSDLYLLYQIRNEFAHKSQAFIDTQKVFGDMSKLTGIDDELKKLPNDAIKYAKTILFYRDVLIKNLDDYAKRNNFKPQMI